MVKKMSITAIFIGAVMFGINTPHIFAQKPGCPEDCKCGPDVNCKDRNCEKGKTDTCICKKYP